MNYSNFKRGILCDISRRRQSIHKIRDHGEEVQENTELESLPLPFEFTDTPTTDEVSHFDKLVSI